VPSAHATWSIVIADSLTKEVAVGTVTCLTSYDLLAIVPVVVVGKGAGACQASGDFAGIRRPIMFDHLILGTPPQEILDILAGVTGHQSRQYGIADTQGRMVTFTGSSCSQWAGGVVGTDGTLVYAIQGNILAGDCVVPAIELALLNTAGDIPAKLMAGMEAARQTGGDGRCSCSPSDPQGCGCPPSSFDKSGHIGTMVVARIGDSDDPDCAASGCADGDYFMKLNVPFQSSSAPDPVLQLQSLFDDWRADLDGRPDAIQSPATFESNPDPPAGMLESTLHITLLDWRGEPISVSIQSLTVNHAPQSDNLSTIGPVTDDGDGSYSVVITTCESASGTDLFAVTADDGFRPVVLMPNPTLAFFGDATPPTPNPMTWETPPEPVSTTELTMTATEATDETPPCEYFFLWRADGQGGNSSGWQTPRTYNDDGLTANAIYSYQVAARDSVCPYRNITEYSFPRASTATHIEAPTGISFDNVDDTSMDVTAEGTFTSLTGDQSGQPPNQSGIFFEMTPDEGSGANVWVTTETISVTGLTPDTEYTFNVRARNYFAVETEAFGPVSQSTTGGVACPLMGDVNQDGGVNGADISGYVRAQLGQDPLPGENPACADYPVADFVDDLLGEP
jgi:hypothetical protein